MKDRRKLLWMWAALTVFLLVWALRLKGHAVTFTDTTQYVFPEKWVSVEQWCRGWVPLWNPYIACGMPHLANWQSACFYPPFWLWNVTGLWDWFYVLALLHVAWAVFGFSLWARRLGVSPVPSLLASLGFAFSSQMTQFWGFPTHLSTMSWIPWIFLAADRILERPTFPRWAGLTACVSLQVLAGYPNIMIYTFLFLGLWVAIRRPGAKVWGSIVLSGVGMMILTAVQWIPALDFMGYADRSARIGGVYSLRLEEYLPILGPRLLGMPNTTQYRGTLPNFIFLPGYVGWVVLAVLAAAFFHFRRVRERFFLIAALGVLVWGLGTNFAPWRWVFGWMVGVLEPAKASVLWAFCACTAAATLFTQAWPFLKGRLIWRRVALFLAIIMAVELLSVPSRVLRLMPDPLRDATVVGSTRQLSRMTGNGRLVSLRQRGRELWSGQSESEGYLWESALQAFPNTNAVLGLRSAGAYLSTTVDGYQNMLIYLQKGFPYEGRILDAASVNTLALPEKLTGIKYQVAMTQGGVLFHSNAGAMPNAWKVSWVKELKDRPAVFEAMAHPDIFLEENVLTEDRSNGKAVMLPPPRRTLSGPHPPATIGERLKAFLRGDAPSRGFTDREPSPSRASFEADFRERGWMVFSESFVPGWRAWVDGEPVSLFRADGLFMAVPVDKEGIRRIDFRYEPVAFRLGLFLSLIGVVAFLGAWFARTDTPPRRPVPYRNGQARRA